MDYTMKKKIQKEIYTKDKEVEIMPTIELIEHERVAYVKGMEDYLNNLKRMEHKAARKKSFENLVQCNIIHENGEFTERYTQAKVVLN